LIENYDRLKDRLQHAGHTFKSATDTEVLAHLIGEHLEKNKKVPAEEGVHPLARAVREEIRAVDPAIPVFRIQTMEEVAAAMLAARRTSMLVLGLFAGCAVLLAAMGVYGVTSYLVGLRLRVQLRSVAAGEPARSAVAPGELGALERTRLKDALRAVRGLQEAGALHFKTQF
jgi:glucosamine 6-phosphate synthetase-like amidotransferase/phosphosugar isomerase protein